jgi:hypothetical protein
MAAKTRSLSELRRRARHGNPDREAGVAEHRRAMEDALALADVLDSRSLTQVERTEGPGIAQGNVSRLDGCSDVYLSTLGSYVALLGGHLELAAVFGSERITAAVSRPGSTE